MDFDLKEQFQELFGAAPAFTAFAPGRVNLIGEHIDYNGGHVLPCALSLGISGAIRLRDDGLMRFASAQFPESGITEHPLDDLLEEIAQNASVKKRDWTMYVRGVLWSYAQRGYSVDRGFDLLVGGDLPGNAGLSSSAALEVLTARLFAAAYGIGDLQDPTFLPLLAQNAENGYVGMHCGIMDQYASANG